GFVTGLGKSVFPLQSLSMPSEQLGSPKGPSSCGALATALQTTAVVPSPLQTFTPCASQAPMPTVHGSPTPRPSSITPLPLLSLPSQISALLQSGSRTSGRPSQSLSVLSRQVGSTRRAASLSPVPPSACQSMGWSICAQLGFVPADVAVKPTPVAAIAGLGLHVPPPQSRLLRQAWLLLLQIPMRLELTFMQNEWVSSRPTVPLVGSGQGRWVEPGTQKPEIGQLPLQRPQGAPG